MWLDKCFKKTYGSLFGDLNIDYMIKILMEAAMRAAKEFENFNIFLIL